MGAATGISLIGGITVCPSLRLVLVLGEPCRLPDGPPQPVLHLVGVEVEARSVLEGLVVVRGIVLQKFVRRVAVNAYGLDGQKFRRCLPVKFRVVV